MLSLNCKHVQHVKICIPWNLTFISNSFWNKGRKALKCWKFDEKRVITPKWVTGFTSKLHGMQILTCWTCLQFKIYLPCNFEVNFITYFGVITLFSSNFQHFNTFRPLFQKLLEINVQFKLQTCSACWHAEHVSSLNLTFISNSFWNKGRKVLKCWKFDEKREITPK
jgi:hypothetical protein